MNKLLTVEQAAELLGMSPSTVRRRITEGVLPAQKVGGGKTSAWVIARADLEASRAHNPTRLLSPIIRRRNRPTGGVQ